MLHTTSKPMFIQVNAVDICGEQMKYNCPMFVKFKDIVKYQVTGFPTKKGDDIEKFTYEIWTSDNEHYFITDDENVLEFMRAVSE